MIDCVILAAGEGTRMKSKKPKVLHEACGEAMISWVVEMASSIADKIIIVVGFSADTVKDYVKNRFPDLVEANKLVFVTQKEQLGTAHAVMQAKDELDSDFTIILNGDTPLIKAESLTAAIYQHKAKKSKVTVMTAEVKKPFGYGRIIKNNGLISKIVEEKDASVEEKKLNEVNSGFYIFDTKFLKNLDGKFTNDNKQNEFYLTDSIEIANNSGGGAESFLLENSKEMFGVNSCEQLEKANRIMQRRINRRHMEKGVKFTDARTAYIQKDVEIGRDTIIGPNTVIQNGTSIGEDCQITNSRISNSTVGRGTNVENSVVLDSKIGNDTKIGPFAYIRPNSNIGNGNRIGDFVEIKNSNIADGTKVSHLTYVGDADVGRDVNFGCGSVVVNYDGKKKHRTIVGDNSFIGCNVNLISPVKVGANSFIAAGSTITEDVPENALAIARSRQTNKDDYLLKDGGGSA